MRKTTSFLSLLFCLPWLAFAPGRSAERMPFIRKDKDYALFFAVNQYKHLDNLNNPIQNARDIAREMEQS